MKKIIALLLSAMMLLSCTAAFAEESEFVDFSVENLHRAWDGAGKTPEEWAADGVWRAMLTLTMLVECDRARNAGADSYNVYDSYVAYNAENESFVIVVACGEDSSIVLLYSRSYENGSYLMCEGISAQRAVEILSSDYSFTANTKDDLNVIASVLEDM